MIVINNLNKYYNKGKNNEIHAINNTSIVFPDKGLVCLTGPSGCGKTTLLNCIGGMDNPSSGFISYDGVDLTKKELDLYRAQNIGFVFQNYILLPDRTVYENLKIVLNMFNLSKEEEEERIEFALNAVNMFKYRKRICGQLSGGQMQRVSIARALVKSPKLIIADEPTGNLDEKNTKQVMDIIKNLSRECLVIMVTHENRLATFYSDRIIKIEDGRIISDSINDSKGILTEKDEINIYLGEMKSEQINSDNVYIRYFYTTEKPNIKIDVVYKNDTYFIKASSDNKVNFKFLTGKSEEILIEGKKPVIQIDDVMNEDIKFPQIDKNNTRKSVISFKEAFKEACLFFKKIRIGDKIKLFVFFLSAIMFVNSIASLGKLIHIDETQVVRFSKDIVVIEEYNSFDSRKIESKINKGLLLANYQIFDSMINFNYFYKDGYVRTSPSSPFPIEYLNDEDIIIGKKASSDEEVVIDKKIIDNVAERTILGNQLEKLGYESLDQLIGLKYIKYKNISDKEYTIVGITDTGSCNVYFTENAYKLMYLNELYMYSYVIGYQGLQNNIIGLQIENASKIQSYVDITTGETTTLDINDLKDNEIIVSKGMNNDFINQKVFSNSAFKFLSSIKIKGYFVDNDNNYMLGKIAGNDNLINAFYYSSIETNKSFVCFRDDVDKVDENYTTYDPYKRALEQYKNNNLTSTVFSLVMTIVFFSVSLIFLVFTIRSNLISRIYQIGAYRALGIGKVDIYKIFICEILLMMSVSSFIGFISGSLVATYNTTSILISTAYYPWYSWIISFVLILGINLVCGLLPVILMLLQTPAQILSKYDI